MNYKVAIDEHIYFIGIDNVKTYDTVSYFCTSYDNDLKIIYFLNILNEM